MKRSAIISALLFAAMVLGTTACSEKTETPQSSAVGVHVTALGMHCDGCEETIETTFIKMPGVDSVKADYTTGDVFVLVDTSKTSYSRLEDLVVELGFDKMNDDMNM